MALLRNVFRIGGRRLNSWRSETTLGYNPAATTCSRRQGGRQEEAGCAHGVHTLSGAATLAHADRHFGSTTVLRSSDGDRPTKPNKEVTYDELVGLIQKGDVHLIDVREPRELDATGAIPLATNIPLTQVKRALHLEEDEFWECYHVAKPSKDDMNVVFYGLTEVKCSAAVQISNKLGYKKVRHYPGGWQEWEARQCSSQ